MDGNRPRQGFATTLSVVASLKDPALALPLLGAALEEKGPVRREALRLLLRMQGPAPAAMVVRGFALLSAEERAEALHGRQRLLCAASAVLGERDRGARLGLAAFAAALPSAEGLDLLRELVDDPAEPVRRSAREALLRSAREHAAGRFTPAAPRETRSLVAAIAAALRRAPEGEASPLINALLRAARESREARSEIVALAAAGPPSGRSALLDVLSESLEPAAVSVLCDLAGAGPAPWRERAAAILRGRREPGFLRLLAEEAAARMETPAGLSATLVAPLSQAPWESLSAGDLSRLPVVAQRRLFSIARTFRGDPALRARRLAVFLRSPDLRVRELALESVIR